MKHASCTHERCFLGFGISGSCLKVSSDSYHQPVHIKIVCYGNLFTDSKYRDKMLWSVTCFRSGLHSMCANVNIISKINIQRMNCS